MKKIDWDRARQIPIQTFGGKRMQLCVYKGEVNHCKKCIHFSKMEGKEYGGECSEMNKNSKEDLYWNERQKACVLFEKREEKE